MIADFLKDYISDPAQLERANEILNYQFYGLTLPQISAISASITTLIYFFPGRDKRPFLVKLFDFFMVWLCLVLFVLCLGAGLVIGKRLDETAIGGFTGLFVFWMIYNVYGIVRNKVKSKKDREALARSLNMSLDSLKPRKDLKK